MSEPRCVSCRAPMAASTAFCPHCGATQSWAGTLELGMLLDDRYRILARLGEGAMSAVYLARYERLEREVAIKTLRSLLVDHPTAVQRFTREARVVAGLAHPNIVQVFDFGLSDRESPYLVMEHIAGVTLE